MIWILLDGRSQSSIDSGPIVVDTSMDIVILLYNYTYRYLQYSFSSSCTCSGSASYIHWL